MCRMTAEEELAAPIVVRTGPLFWCDEQKVVEGLTTPQLRIFWAVQLDLVERKRRWFGRGWKIRWKPN
jgi:hypothetical protein